MKKLLTSLLIFCLFSCSTFAKEEPDSTETLDTIALDLEKFGFVERNIPERDSIELQKANHMTPGYLVTKKDNKLEIRKPKNGELFQNSTEVDTGEIKYIGVDNGEWGGGLYIDKVEPYKAILQRNINALIPIKHDLYIISGLAHMGYNAGAIHVIHDYKNTSKVERITLLPNAPMAIYADEIDENNFVLVIAGFNNFMLVTDNHLEIPFNDTFWAGLYPNSIVKHNNSYIIGIRSGLAVVTNPRSYKREIRYFVPK